MLLCLGDHIVCNMITRPRCTLRSKNVLKCFLLTESDVITILVQLFCYKGFFDLIQREPSPAASGRGVGGALPPSQSLSLTYLPPLLSLPTSLTRASLSLGPGTHGWIWKGRCVRSGPRESVRYGRYWWLWCPAARRSCRLWYKSP